MHHYTYLIIGSGFGGLATAIQLQKRGITDFLILERDHDLGGTWYANQYPGAQVDVPSHLYSLSFEPYNWSRLFAKQEEILTYTHHILNKHQLRKKASTNANVTELRFDDQKQIWQVSCEDGRVWTANFVINATGILSQPNIPTFKGQDQFKGKAMHTAQWDRDFDYRQKKVAVIGNGASAIQVVPTIAPEVKHLTVFQRTPHWVTPRPDRELASWERKWLQNYPLVRKIHRHLIYAQLELRILAFQNPSLLKLYQLIAKRHLNKQVSSPTLRQRLTPNYILGCKRILLSNEYYPALQRNNVTLLSKMSGIQEFTETGIQTIDGRHIEVDLMVYATGFKASEGLIGYPIVGKNGISLQEVWANYPHAYLGATIPHFPNLFMIAGPNTGIGHTSALFMLEAQLQYLFNIIDHQQKEKWTTFEVKEEVEKAYNEKIQRDLAKTVWQSGGCKSWYQTESGVNSTLYPYSSLFLWRDCSRFKPEEHLFETVNG